MPSDFSLEDPQHGGHKAYDPDGLRWREPRLFCSGALRFVG